MNLDTRSEGTRPLISDVRIVSLAMPPSLARFCVVAIVGFG